MIGPTTVQQNYLRVRGLIDQACRSAGRDPGDVRLLPVSKTHPVALIRPVLALGCGRLAENKVQEMVAKAAELAGSASWTLVGHLQRNKVPQAAQAMSELQSLDSTRLAEALERHHEAVGLDRLLPVMVEVNTSGEPSKWGLDPEQTMEFTRGLRSFPHLLPTGLMTVAHPDPRLAEQGFQALAELRRRLQDRDGQGWQELSMGMSGDFEAAIRWGSTCVRIGTAIFGTRQVAASTPS